MTKEEYFLEMCGLVSEGHCEDCIWRGDGEEVCDDNYCYEKGMIVQRNWSCLKFKSVKSAEEEVAHEVQKS